MDRTISSGLILLAIVILLSRKFQWGEFLARNLALTAFLSFALLSVLWSDFPFVTFKRWFRDLGNYLMILVVLSDRLPLDAVRTVLRRLSYLVIPLSVLLIKYFPETGRSYDYWTGIATFSGATTSKNMLGVACLVSGLFLFWDTMTRWSSRKERRSKVIIALNTTFIGMTLWLLNLSSSTTSRVCLALGCLVVLAAHSKFFTRRPRILYALIPTAFLLYLILAYGFGLSGDLAGAVGKDPTLTDRTKIWGFLLGMHTNPLLGVGYESFWLGSRLQWFWQRAGLGMLNEAHNGYLEVYLNLGIVGLCFLTAFLAATYGRIYKDLRPTSSFASLALVLWFVLLFYSITEAGFRNSLLWLTFLLGALAAPHRGRDRSPALDTRTYDDIYGPEQFLTRL